VSGLKVARKKKESSGSGLLPPAAAAATGILVGSAMVATRFVIDQTAPASLALFRYAIGFCCLLPPVILSGRVRLERRDLLPIGLLGITQFGILIALLNYSLQFIPSARAALIFATMPSFADGFLRP
jgi:drug/metabolite transporter (DMT)-like permease